MTGAGFLSISADPSRRAELLMMWVVMKTSTNNSAPSSTLALVLNSLRRWG
jgi:hypothetical protein